MNFSKCIQSKVALRLMHDGQASRLPSFRILRHHLESFLIGTTSGHCVSTATFQKTTTKKKQQ
jgi:hypothetical protein